MPLRGLRASYGEPMHDAIRKSREILTRLEGIEAEYAAENEMRDARHVEMWTVPPITQETEGTSQMTSTWDEWHAWARSIAVEVCGELADEAGAVTGQLEAELRQLRDELNQLRADIAIERSLRNGDVVDLPRFIRRRNDNAA
jgi:hypothetical protein